MLEFLIPGLFLITLILILYKRGVPEQWIYLILALSFPYFIRDLFSFLLFAVSSVFGGVTDWIGVHRNQWRYTRDSYPLWIWPSWGYTVLIVHLVTSKISVNPLLAMIAASLTAVSFDQYFNSHDISLRFLLRLGIILPLLYYTELLLFGAASILAAVFVEVMGCKIIKAWRYKTPHLFAIGTAYAGLSWTALRLVQTILTINPVTPVEILALVAFILVTFKFYLK